MVLEFLILRTLVFRRYTYRARVENNSFGRFVSVIGLVEWLGIERNEGLRCIAASSSFYQALRHKCYYICGLIDDLNATCIHQ